MRRPDGFTVVELMVGLVVAGLVVLIARATLAETAFGSERLISTRSAFDARANGRRWLAAAFRSLQVGQGGDDGFRGSPNGVVFTSRLQVGPGWFEAERLRVERSANLLLIRRANRDSVVLSRNVAEIETQYLLTTGERSEWLRGWYSPSTAPLAVRLIVWTFGQRPDRSPSADTLLLLIGSRG